MTTPRCSLRQDVPGPLSCQSRSSQSLLDLGRCGQGFLGSYIIGLSHSLYFGRTHKHEGSYLIALLRTWPNDHSSFTCTGVKLREPVISEIFQRVCEFCVFSHERNQLSDYFQQSMHSSRTELYAPLCVLCRRNLTGVQTSNPHCYHECQHRENPQYHMWHGSTT